MSRFLSLAEAVELTIRDGDTVAMEGFTHLIPYAAGHEVIRQRRRHLTLIRMTPDLIYANPLPEFRAPAPRCGLVAAT